MPDREQQTTQEARGATYRDPAEIIAETIADVRDREGKVMVGRATRKKAARVLEALRAEGWRVLR